MIGFTASREELRKKEPAEPDAPETPARTETSCTSASTQISVTQPGYHAWRYGWTRPIVGRSR